jgi:hypothetical protein
MVKINRRIKYCKCGCGLPVTWNKHKKCFNDYIVGHNRKGIPQPKTKEERRKQSIISGGDGILKEDRIVQPCACGCGKIANPGMKYINGHSGGLARKGVSPWNKGLTKETDERVAKCAESLIGHIVTEDTTRKNREKHLLLNQDPEYIAKRKEIRKSYGSPGELNPMYGIHRFGKDCPGWQGGKSFEIYPQEWNNYLKEQIRWRDDYKCQVCLISQDELDTKLHVHHIDYDKKNCKEENLISLCNNCHAKTSGKNNRETWQSIFASQ